MGLGRERTPNEIWAAGVRSVGHRGSFNAINARVAALCRHPLLSKMAFEELGQLVMQGERVSPNTRHPSRGA